MDIRQYRDDGRNYIVIKTGGIDKNDYQYRMLQRNDPGHLLPCRIRDIDTERYLYYEISGLYSLDQLFGSARMTETEIRRLYTDLQRTYDEVEAHLLNPEGLLLAPEYIFRKAQGEGYFFLYCVGCAQATEDEALATWIGAHAERPVPPEAVMEEVRQVREEERAARSGNRHRDVADALTTGDFLTEEDWMREAPDPLWRIDTGAFLSEDLAPVQAMYGSEADEERPRGRIGSIVMGVLFALTMGAIVVLRNAYELSKAENVISAAIGVVCAVMMGFSVYSLLKKRKIPGEKTAATSETEREMPERTDSGESEFLFREHEAAFCKQERGRTPETAQMGDFDGEEGETVLLQPGMMAQGHKLYSRDEGRLIKIDLSKLPLTVGKLPGVADFLLKREEISRLHVRFTKEEGTERILMKDLNSTNGTFRNGMRLNAGESVALFPGDEVRLGSLEFEFV